MSVFVFLINHLGNWAHHLFSGYMVLPWCRKAQRVKLEINSQKNNLYRVVATDLVMV